jgi:hypothetical protein
LAALLALAGCSTGGGDRLIPVEGSVTVDGKPLTGGAVIFYPDPAKGNTSGHEPRGDIGPDGRYKITTGGTQQPGAAAGWYKVSVYSGVRTDPNNAYSPEQFLTSKKYLDKDKSGLEVEVKDGAPPGSYDFKLQK